MARTALVRLRNSLAAAVKGARPDAGWEVVLESPPHPDALGLRAHRQRALPALGVSGKGP